jgi:hypothetical protein
VVGEIWGHEVLRSYLRPSDHVKLPFHPHRLMKRLVTVKLVSTGLFKTKLDCDCFFLGKSGILICLRPESFLTYCSEYFLAEYDDQVERNDRDKAGGDKDTDPKTGGQRPIIAD